ncbi:cytochrome P450 [Pacificimonas flava]|uniref:Cytochrome P450 n=2 Tax=Pacificimonas TaxID=1960290 RepID=A0A219B0Y4_9SPHN|nr:MULTISPECIES: cytochrome P450 [Pacificimonas]MBZ6379672.1 cytochrome P450 [Pacificimonas aurantium]OWV31864.1 cytochrome P450 [Pacificimonas flava]
MADNPFPGFSTDGIDNRLVNPDVMAQPDDIHDVYRRLRAEDPVHWAEPTGFRPFWAITKHDDIKAIGKANETFTNSQRTYLAPAENEEHMLQMTGDTHLFRTLVDLDDPLHRHIRAVTNEWFKPGSLKKTEDSIREIARDHVERMASLGGECDFVNEVALFYPLRVVMKILGIPPEDELMMLQMTQETFGAADPDVVARSQRITSGGTGTMATSGEQAVDLIALAQSFFEYFGKVIADRKQNPRDDVATVIANAEIEGEPMDLHHQLSYFVIVATAGHDTTSSSTSGGLLQLIRNPEQLQKLKDEPKLMMQAVEEMIRWETPVKHFMRTCQEDFELRGRTIRKGDGVCLFYWSGNRDEDVFEDPYRFDVERRPNQQIAFGFGVHQCLGLHLARLEMRVLFEELVPRLKHIELAGDPAWTRSNFVSGLKRLPIRYEMS